ncbi:MAG: transcription termination/antitermination factor NusG [Fusobacteriia bacterium 4572_132]|nr:MAG: transcription termination/antitermination factor NusG [Fusobacteriia bacterium 4572_132]
MVQKKLEKKWYAIHTYSGYEKKVKTDLEKRVVNLGLDKKVFRIVVPEEEKIEIKRGKPKKVFRKLFPGYVLVEMEVLKEEGTEGIGYCVDSEVWYVIRNTAGVTGFVGIGSDPSPLEEREVSRLLGKKAIAAEKMEVGFAIGDKVGIEEGAFEGRVGEVSEIDFEQQHVKVMVDLFGRMTPVEVKFKGVLKK